MTLNNLRIGHRLAIGFGAVLALGCVIVALAWFHLARTSDGLISLTREQARAGVAHDWATKSQLNMTRAIAIAKAAGQPDIDNYFTPLIKQTTAEIGEAQKSLDASVDDEASKALLAVAAEKRRAYIALREELMELVKQSDAPAAQDLLTNKMLPASEAYLGAMQAVQAQQAKAAAINAETLSADVDMAGRALLALLGASLAVGGAMSWLITRSITVPLRQGAQAATVMAGGDLSQPVDSVNRDEIGDVLRALGKMQLSLRSLVSDVRTTADSIGTASAEIAIGNQDLSARTEQTASNLQQTASSMEQLTGTVKQSADSARQANQLANSAAEVAARGGVVVSQVVSTMEDINTSSRKIADIIGVIDGIAFQTNILALNAAVEAARAGEQGRGFAVVASEVRSLAQRSAGAAKEIKGLIGASVEKVENGSRLVASAGSTMTEIVNSVQRVSDIIGEITAASAEQSQGIGEINGAVAQLDQMTQQNAALVEESAAAADSLKAQAQKLGQVIGTFTLARAPGTPAAPAVRAQPASTKGKPSFDAATVSPAPTSRPAPAAAPVADHTSTPTQAPAPVPATATTARASIKHLPVLTQAVTPRPEPVATTVVTDEWETF